MQTPFDNFKMKQNEQLIEQACDQTLKVIKETGTRRILKGMSICPFSAVIQNKHTTLLSNV